MIHANTAENREFLVATSERGFCAEGARYSFVISERQDADTSGLTGGESSVVADFVTFFEVDGFDDG